MFESSGNQRVSSDPRLIKHMRSKQPFQRGKDSGRARYIVRPQFRLRRYSAGHWWSAGTFKLPCQCRDTCRRWPVGGCVKWCVLLAVHKRKWSSCKLERSDTVVVESSLWWPRRWGLCGTRARATLARRTYHSWSSGTLRRARWRTLHRRPGRCWSCGCRPRRSRSTWGCTAVARAL